MPELIIKLNTNLVPNDCPFCRKETNPNLGADIFLAGTNTVVCYECACKQSPILAGLITFSDISRLYLQAENNFGEQWESEQTIVRRKSFEFKKEVRNVKSAN